jgi:hypothetical protein
MPLAQAVAQLRRHWLTSHGQEGDEAQRQVLQTVQRRITVAIQAAPTWQHAFDLFTDFSDVFNGINTSVLISRLVTLLRARRCVRCVAVLFKCRLCYGLHLRTPNALLTMLQFSKRWAAGDA